MGINLYLRAGADSTTETIAGGTSADNSGPNAFTYNVDLSAGEVVNLSGNWGTAGQDIDGGYSGNGEYQVVSGTPSFGTLSLNSADGTFSYSFTETEVAANGGNQILTMQISGRDFFDVTDTDTVNINITCFGRGTQITTPKGETAVEALAIGDMIRTADGRVVAVKWVARQILYPSKMGLRSDPVRISAGALGCDLPTRDLTVTGDHGMVIDDMVINASALVNGANIKWVPGAEMGHGFTVYHIETQDHDVILANGAPSETFVDYLGRRSFDNYAEYVELYGSERIIPEMRCIRISAHRHLPASIRERLGISSFDAAASQPFNEATQKLDAA